MKDSSWGGPYSVPAVNGGEPWLQRGILFVTRQDDTILRQYVCPDTASGDFDTSATWWSTFHQQELKTLRRTTWWAPEWSNHPYFASVSAQARRRFDTAGAYGQYETDHAEIVYVVNLRDSSYLKVVETTNTTSSSRTHMPWCHLWVEVPDGFIEQPGWLDPQAAAEPVRRVLRGNRAADIRLNGNTVRCSVPIRSAALYDLGGRRLWMSGVQTGECRSVQLPAQRLGAGMRVVRVRTREGGEVWQRLVNGNCE